MICIGNFNEKSYMYFRYFRSKAKNFVVFTFTYVSRSPGLFNDDFCMNLYSVDSNETRHKSVKRSRFYF
jgi:hypothetical protein